MTGGNVFKRLRKHFHLTAVLRRYCKQAVTSSKDCYLIKSLSLDINTRTLHHWNALTLTLVLTPFTDSLKITRYLEIEVRDWERPSKKNLH